jgi:hypothetical protein
MPELIWKFCYRLIAVLMLVRGMRAKTPVSAESKENSSAMVSPPPPPAGKGQDGQGKHRRREHSFRWVFHNEPPVGKKYIYLLRLFQNSSQNKEEAGDLRSHAPCVRAKVPAYPLYGRLRPPDPQVLEQALL